MAAGQGGYGVYLSREFVLDCRAAFLTGECLASAANSPTNLWNVHTGKPARANVKLQVRSVSRETKQVSLRSGRDHVRRGTELLYSYQSSFVYPAQDEISDSDSSGDAAAGTAEGAHPAKQPAASRDLATARASARARTRLDALPVLTSADADQQLVNDSLQFLQTVAAALHLSPLPTTADITSTLAAAHAVVNGLLGPADAQAFGADFRFPAEALDRDLLDFTAHGHSLPALARARQASLAPTRLSLDRVHAVFGPTGTTHPSLTADDFKRLCRLATVGIDVLQHEEFVPDPTPAELRTKYTLVASAVHRLLYKQVREGTLVVLPIGSLIGHPGIHLANCVHWTTKKNKPEGRLIADLSNAPPNAQGTPLNGSAGSARKLMAARYAATYGPITHPTLSDLMTMILDQADRFGWDRLRIWKKDLSGAFNLLWFNPDHVQLLAFPLLGDLVAVHLAGLFGLGGLPPAFAVISRAIDAASATTLQGASAMYVDDDLGVSPEEALNADMAAADSIMKGLLGPRAVAEDKDESGRCLEWIGWDVDLDSRTVTASARNLLKVTHAFFSFHLTDRVSAEHLTRMASYASRLSMLHPLLRPFTLTFYTELTFFGENPRLRRALSGAARADVAMWRSFLLVFHTAPAVFARNIESFRQSRATLDISYDASLSGLGVGLIALDGAAPNLLAFAAVTFPYAETTDSSLQNTYEYVAIIAGLLLARRLGLRDFTFTLHGDSVSSLQWSVSNRAASVLARRANIAMVLLSLHLRATLLDTTHVRGVDNVTYDGLSRGRSAEELGLDPSRSHAFDQDSTELHYLSLCDPRAQLTSFHDHTALIAQCMTLLNANP